MKRDCKYSFGKFKNITYEQLLLRYYELSESDKEGITDYLFQVNKQEFISKELEELKKKNKDEVQVDKDQFVSGEITFSEVNNRDKFNPLSFIDSIYFTKENGDRIVPYIDRGNFIEYLVKLFKIEDGMSADEARSSANEVVRHWDLIALDSILLHKLLSRYFLYHSELQEEVKDTRFLNISESLYEQLDKARNACTQRIRDGKIIRNLKLKAELYGLDSEIIGHIDNIIIDAAGDIHIINYKVTSTVIDDEKLEKYKYQMALLKLMLAANGFDTKHINLYIIPIFVKYSDDYKTVQSVQVQRRINFSYDNNGRYIFQQYDSTAERFIKSKVTIAEIDRSNVEDSDKFLRALFDLKKITSDGIELSAQEWIRRYKDSRIIPVTDKPGVKWKIIFSSTDIKEIKDFHNPEKNKEILEEVEKRLNDLDMGNHEMSAHNIVKLFLTAKEHKGFYSFALENGYERSAKFLDKIFKPYLTGRTLRNGEFSPDWEIIEDDMLLSRNIIAILNKHTNQIDIITVSPHNLKENPKFRRVYENILGEYLSDLSALQEQIITGNYGNIEMVRTMLLLNAAIPGIKGDFKFGQIQIISPENIGNEVTYTFPQAIEQFSKIRRVVQNNNKDVSINNNFLGVKTVDPIEVFLKALDNAMDETRTIINERGATVLRDPASTREQRLLALKNIMRSLEQTYQFNSFDNLDSTASKSLELFDAVNLYKVVTKSILELENISDEINYNEEDISSLESDFQAATSIGSNNIRLIGNLFFETVNRIADKSFTETRPILNYLTQFYRLAGYTNIQNEIVGNLEVVFKRLYQEVNGKRIMKFKNPYTDATLLPYEREFLKKVLFTLAKTRLRMFPTKVKFLFTSYNDPELKKFAEETPWYLEVPLMKASKSTNRFTKQGFSEWATKVKRIFTLDGGKNITEFMEGLSSEQEVARMNDAMSTLTIDNRYGWYETAGGCENARLEKLELHPVEYFEYNVETILMNFITALNEVEELDDFMLKTRAILLVLNTIGDEYRFKNTLEYIRNYLKLNVYNKQIVEDSSRKLMSIVAPARHLATSVYILGNLASGVRDLTEGLLLNFVRASIKFLTNISRGSLAKAYAYVTKHSITSARSISLLNQLNIKYRISNVDIARIQEVLATGRSGIKNYENWLYATMRKPDFINRMSLFVARCMEDGVWDALSVDEDGNFKYNWKEDKRFKDYAERKNQVPPPTDLKFLESKGRYFSAILEYNRENPDKALNIQDPNVALPNPYTNTEIESIKLAADSIYGSYDKSKKAMYEFLTKGVILGQFTTWMNGMIGNYLRKPGTKTGELMRDYERSDSGERLFLDEYSNIVVEKTREDGSKYYVNEDNGKEVTGTVVPLFKNVPVISQGIIYSVINIFKKTLPLGYEKNGLSGAMDEFMKEIWSNEQEKRNLLKLLSDLGMWLFMGTLYGFAINPAYKELVKDRDKSNFLVNSIEDILYRGTSSSYDGFRGPWNVIDSFGNNMNPPAYKVTTKMATDIFKTAIGKKTVGLLVTQNVPVFRSFRKAYDLYTK